MKLVLGLDKYRRYQAENEVLRKKVAEMRSENDSEAALKLIRLAEREENNRKWFIISAVLLAVCSGIYGSVLSMYGKYNLIWVIAVAFVVWLGIFEGLKIYTKNKKKKIQEEHNKLADEEAKIVKIFKENQEKLFKIIVYIICINDFYHELINLDGEERKNKWKEITNRQIEAINSYVKYDICNATYQMYFNEWLSKQEIYG